MTDEPTPTPPETEGQPEPTPSPEPDNQPEPKPDVSAMERALKKANKEAEQARLKLKEIEDSQKSEAQKLADEKAAAVKEAVNARQELLRYRVAATKGLPAEVADRLKGETEEEMAEDAERLIAILKPGKPSGSADGGQRGKPASPTPDMNDLLRAAARGS